MDVTLLIPHFQTLDAIRLCLRSIRRYTDPAPRVLVLDNGSRDGARDYLRSLTWVECVDTGIANDLVAAQAAALNLGAARVRSPVFAVLHSDTYVHRAGWLSMLLRVLRRGYAAVGSRHQTIRVYDAAWAARLAERSAPLLARWRGRTTGDGVPWLRSCLTLYRTAAFRAAGCAFASDGREDATHAANAALAARGERLLSLPDRAVGYYVFHKGDTTRIANRLFRAADPEFAARIRRHRRHVDGFLARPATRAILADASLDR
ncbi:glycosyltransferase [bacterium]|nr:glycosyltransferase [bacterium]